MNVAAKYPNILVEEKNLEEMVYNLVNFSQKYDVILTMNPYGDIITNVGLSLVGGKN